jgi:hypothetical protein
MTKKVAYISYVEDTRKHHGILAKAAKKATAKAVRRAKAASISITYVENGKIIAESPTGKKTIVGTVNKSRKVKVGSKATIS